MIAIVDVVSPAITLIDEQGRRIGRRDPWATHPAGCRFVTLFATPAAHPAVVMRRATLAKHSYSSAPETVHTEEREFWSRLARTGCGVANLREPLVRVPVLQEGVSSRYEDVESRNLAACVARRLRDELGEDLPLDLVEVIAGRMGFRHARVPLREGLRILEVPASRVLAKSDGAVLVNQEIREAAAIQSANILIRCLLERCPRLRARTALSLLGRRSKWRGRSRREIGSKLRARRRYRRPRVAGAAPTAAG